MRASDTRWNACSSLVDCAALTHVYAHLWVGRAFPPTTDDKPLRGYPAHPMGKGEKMWKKEESNRETLEHRAREEVTATVTKGMDALSKAGERARAEPKGHKALPNQTGRGAR